MNQIRHPEWIQQHYEGVNAWDSADPVRVEPLQVTTIDFILEKGGNISGYVYENDGITSVEGTFVEAFGFTLDGQHLGELTTTIADGS